MDFSWVFFELRMRSLFQSISCYRLHLHVSGSSVLGCLDYGRWIDESMTWHGRAHHLARYGMQEKQALV